MKLRNVLLPELHLARLLTDKACIDLPSMIGASLMLSKHITSFFNLIRAQLEETSRGVASIHHFHNVRCGIENILCLLEYNNDVVEKADQLSRRASSYITRHDFNLIEDQ